MVATSSDDLIPRGLRVLLGAAAATVVLAGLRSIGDIVGPVFLALVLTVLVHPARAWLQGRRVPGWAASTALIVLVYLLVLGLAATLLGATARFATILPTYQDSFDDLLAGATAWLEGIGVGPDQLAALREPTDFSRLVDLFSGLLGGLLGIASSLLFICTLVLFMTFDAKKFPGNLAAVALDRPGIGAAFSSFAVGTRTYLLVSTVFGLIVAVLDTIALALLGIPVPVLWGLLSFMTNYIPNIGFVIGLIPPAVLALLEGGPGLMLAVIAVYCVINVVLQTVIQPKFVGDAVGLSTTITFLSLVFWTFVLGPLGALLAIPLTLFVKATLIEVDPRVAWIDALTSNRDPQPQDAAAAAVPEVDVVTGNGGGRAPGPRPNVSAEGGS
ncbi:AI-2E family transporter [Nocardioides iriomotensis]|uniref:AI-2E family transporter n=1 Tax=Nocardioides iriomotensis TaxID=715784 RepID=UPI00197D8913|nr:AI-2E family transporter [Nocardioides iriomotensis]